MSPDELKAWSASYDLAHPELAAGRQINARLSAARQRAMAQPFTLAVAREWMAERDRIMADAPPGYGRCACLGCSPGEPLCPCGMATVLPVDGRHVQVTRDRAGLHIVDLGPVAAPS